MNGNFVYCNPTKLYFGEDSLDFLNEELPKYGKNVVLVYGAGSIKENGIYDKVINILKKNEKNIAYKNIIWYDIIKINMMNYKKSLDDFRDGRIN